MSGTGFVDVATQPAGAHSLSVPGLGAFWPGAGPVVGADGSVYLGTVEGTVIALHADGSAYWKRELPPASHERIITAPALGSDQSVYVVGVSSTGAVRDHRGGESRAAQTYHATLYRFTADGGAPVGNSTPIPDLLPEPVPGAFGPRFIGEPNVWRFGADEAVMVPVGYPTLHGAELHLLAFAPAGGVMADALVTRWNRNPDVTGTGLSETWDALQGHFAPAPVESNDSSTIPGISIFVNPLGGTPFVSIPSVLENEIVSYSFCVGPSCSPAPGFTEHVRAQPASQHLLSAPLTLPDLHTVVGTDDGAAFGGPSQTSVAPISGVGAPIGATPTLAVDGSVVLITATGGVVVLRDHAISSRLQLSGKSMARAAASRTHVFVATSDGLHTLDAGAQTELFTFPWVGGGGTAPAIGPDGRVYAMASNILFIFPPRSAGDFDHHHGVSR